MPLTLNQVRNRIETIALAHKQVRSFKRGLVSDQQNDHTLKYPAVFLIDNGVTVSITTKRTVLDFRMIITDLVHQSADAKTNEDDVLSDTLSIAQDLIAQMSANAYNDWRVGGDSQATFISEDEADMRAGLYYDFTIEVPFTQNLCAVPSDLPDITPPDEDTDMKVYYLEYVATGSEGSTLTIPTISGKYIIFIIRENNPLHRVSNAPDPAEFSWDNTNVTLGTPTSVPGERFLIVYRNP